MKLCRRQRAVLDGRQKSHGVGGPGQQCAWVTLPGLCGVGVHKIEPGVGIHALEQPTARCGIDNVPAHVRNHRRVQSGDLTRPLAAPGALNPELDAPGEQNLHADTHAEHRPAGRYPFGDDAVPVDRAQSAHTGLKGSHARHHQAIGCHGRGAISRHRDIGANTLQRTLG